MVSGRLSQKSAEAFTDLSPAFNFSRLFAIQCLKTLLPFDKASNENARYSYINQPLEQQQYSAATQRNLEPASSCCHSQPMHHAWHDTWQEGMQWLTKGSIHNPHTRVSARCENQVWWATSYVRHSYINDYYAKETVRHDYKACCCLCKLLLMMLLGRQISETCLSLWQLFYKVCTKLALLYIAPQENTWQLNTLCYLAALNLTAPFVLSCHRRTASRLASIVFTAGAAGNEAPHIQTRFLIVLN